MTLEDAETLIRRVVKDEFFKQTPAPAIGRKVDAVIDDALKSITLPVLRDAAVRSLRAFAQRQYNAYKRAFGTSVLLVAAMATYTNNKAPAADRRRATQTIAEYSDFNLSGSPMKKYVRDYMRDNVRPALDRIARLEAKDPDDVSGRNSLRNRAEMEVRYRAHEDNIEDLRAAGHRLVIASTHADCSKRCRRWQGRVYSLDGTSGITDDGRRYVPLETATDDYYTTSAGKTYKNGLLGFNCFDDQTQVFTNHGWRLFSELTGNELFYTLDPITRLTEWRVAMNYYRKHYSGDMVHLHSATTDLCVTPDHDLLYNTQKNRRLRFKAAKDFSTATLMYAGQEWRGEARKTLLLGGKAVDTKLYCRFMAYYLADGSIHSKTAVKIAQENNDEMYKELCALPFKVWHDDHKIIVYGKQLHDELLRFGKHDNKYVPSVIKTLPREDICEFLDAYVHTDGYTAKESTINGHVRKPHKTLFTTSKRMESDLCELALKGGFRPKVDIVKSRGKSVKFKNGVYKINHDVFVVHLNARTTITHTKKNIVPYSGYVYCVEVPNHTLLVRRNGRIMWCGNCRHYLVPYKSGYRFPKPNPAEERRQYAITQRQRALERNVRYWRTKAVTSQGIDRAKYTEAKAKATAWNERYIAFSQANRRAYYPSRTTII